MSESIKLVNAKPPRETDRFSKTHRTTDRRIPAIKIKYLGKDIKLGRGSIQIKEQMLKIRRAKAPQPELVLLPCAEVCLGGLDEGKGGE